MNFVNASSQIKHFEDILEEDPSSKAFAPLAESYRKLGLHEKALNVATQGVAHNPDFLSGKVALAQVLLDLKKHEQVEALTDEVLSKAPENLLAYKIRGKNFVLMQKHYEALDSYKRALLINPLDEVSSKMVHKLESLSAQGFETQIFDTTLSSLQPRESQVLRRQNQSLHSALSYIDALISKASYNAALEYIKDSFVKFPSDSELLKRQKYIEGLKQSETRLSRDEVLTKPEITKAKVKSLMSALEHIDSKIKSNLNGEQS